MKRDTPTICVATPAASPEESETFIWAHIKRLPAIVHTLYNGFHPDKYGDGKPVRSRTKRFSYGILNRLFFPGFEDTYSRGIAAFLKRMGIKAVLAEYGPMGLTLMEGCRRAGVPLVVHFHGYDVCREDVLSWAREKYPELFEYAHALIAVSHDMEKQLRELGAPAEKIKYNPCGVDTEFFRGARPEMAPNNVVAVGRFTEKKAPHLTILAFRRVADRIPDAKLMMFGNGHLWGPCFHLAKALNLASRVDFNGNASQAEILRALTSARVFVQHSVRATTGDMEGTPVSIIEASAAGLPVVATRHAGIKESVRNGETGYLVNEGDIDGMAEAISRLLYSPSLAQQMGERGRRLMIAEYELRIRTRRLWEIVQKNLRH